MINKENITEAYLFLRKNNNSIPDEVLQFMLDASLERLDRVRGVELNFEVHARQIVGQELKDMKDTSDEQFDRIDKLQKENKIDQ